MKPLSHLAVSTTVAGILLIAWGRWSLAIGCLIGGVLIDVDHLLDFYLNYRRWTSLRVIYRTFAESRLHHVYLVWHTYEGLIALWLVLWVSGWPSLWVGVGVGLTLHLLCDQAVNPVRPWAYFLCYRIRHRFRREAIIDDSRLYLSAPKPETNG